MTYRRWIALAAVLGAFVVAGGLVAIFKGDFSPRRYVSHHYTRAAAYDLDGGRSLAYTSPRPPTIVAGEIMGAWRPADRYIDGSGVYLRYSDDVITIQPRDTGGCLIRIENVRTAYPRYYGTVGGYWGWATRGGEGVRGGGPGAGK